MDTFTGLAIAAAEIGLDSWMIKPQRGIFEPGSSFPHLITLPSATIEEKSTDEMEITEHPVEQGAQIADHAFKKAAEVVIHCAWSNSVGGGFPTVLPSSPVDLNGIYASLRDLQQSRTLFDLYTGKRKYTNMLLRVITVENDFKTENALFATLQCKQVIIVNTQAVTLDTTKMASPQATASPVPKGGKSLSPSVSSFVQPGY